MSKAKHTPGPWRVVAYHVASEGQKAVATCKPDNPNDPIQRPRDESECMANASLIAAAPDLLEACQLTMSWIQKDDGSVKMNDVIQAITEVIAKAEGR